MDQQHCTPALGPARRSQPSLGSPWWAWMVHVMNQMPELILVWADRTRQRRRLGELDDRMLRDIGVSRAAAWAETRKRFWER